jgi:hypothetical protein
MGLAPARPGNEPSELVFQSFFDWPPVQVVVHLPEFAGHADVRLVAGTRMRNDQRAREYAGEVAAVFATRLQAELVPRLATSPESWKRERRRRKHRAVLKLLKAAPWAWLGVLAVSALVHLPFKGGPFESSHNLTFLLLFWLAPIVAAGADVIRKRLVGTGSEIGDYVYVAGMVGLVVLVSLFYLLGC